MVSPAVSSLLDHIGSLNRGKLFLYLSLDATFECIRAEVRAHMLPNARVTHLIGQPMKNVRTSYVRQ